MPLFALEQIVLLSFAVRERGRGRPPPRERQKRARYEDGTTRDDEGGGTTESSIPGPSVLFPVCFASSRVMRARRLQLYSNTNNRRRRWHWRRVRHRKTRRTADAVIAILVVIARLRQEIRNLHCDDSRVKNKINANIVIPRCKNISLHACHRDCNFVFNGCGNNNRAAR